MSLGKRPRGPMRRTTSMTEITFDLSSGVDAPTVQSNSKDPQKIGLENSTRKQTDGFESFDTRYLSMVSPGNHPRRNPSAVLETPPFLRACSLCKRRLGTGRDIYMYRGESAFCSLECRQQQMNQDERKDKCSLTSMKKEVASSTASETTSNGDRVAAAS